MSERTEPDLDHKEIMEDCPRCAYKHLAAAYSALARCHGEIFVTAAETLAAQARIAAGEAATGYPGNMAHAVGCLALAETLAEEPGVRDRYRTIRHGLTRGDRGDADDLAVSWGSLAAAHIHEARRECPELADRTAWDIGGGMTGLIRDVRCLRDTLRAQLRWLSETYELGYREPGAAIEHEP